MFEFFNHNNDLMCDSYEKYIKPVVNDSKNFYRMFDNNSTTNRVIINGRMDKIVNWPRNLNQILNIDIACGNIVHMPMVGEIYIECITVEWFSIKHLFDAKNLNINNLHHNILTETPENKSETDNIKILSVKSNSVLIFQDIIIQTSSGLILIQIYKFKVPVDNITHGAFIIFQNDFDNSNQNNTILYTKNNKNLLLKSIDDNSKIDFNFQNTKTPKTANNNNAYD
jgi:hypothetical protein